MLITDAILATLATEATEATEPTLKAEAIENPLPIPKIVNSERTLAMLNMLRKLMILRRFHFVNLTVSIFYM